jgi:hypothetical protein
METEKFIVIKNCTGEELKTVLNDWLILYAHRLRDKTVFEIAEINPNIFVLKVDKSIDDTLFFFLVNYCAYPVGFKKTFDVEGHTTATKHKTLLNKKISVFINEKDTEYDNVWITTEENETYKFDFGGKFKKTDFDNRYKAFDMESLQVTYEQITVCKNELLHVVKRKKDEKSRRDVEKRFKIVSTVFFILIPLTFLINRLFPRFLDEDETLTYFLSFNICHLLVTLWFIMDCKIFNDTKRTLICLLLSLLCVVFGINSKDDFAYDLIVISATVPLSSLIVMWTVNRLSGALLDYLYAKLERVFVLAFIVIAVLVSVYVINPLINLLK